MIYLTGYKELNPGWEKDADLIDRIYGKPFEWLDMVQNFQQTAYPYEKEIAQYLETKGDNRNTVTNGFSYDVFTGELIGKKQTSRDDGVISWPMVLPYYIRKYHLRLPKEAEEHILKKIGIK